MMDPRETFFDTPREPKASHPIRIDAFKMDEKRLGSFKGLPERQSDDAEGDRDDRWLRCAHCRSNIARTADRISINGRFNHVFNNPSGYVFEIGCFAMAEGCTDEGHPTMEFTWFAGFNWRFALCGSCRSHLGWFYQSMKGASFYGLIIANLLEESRG